ncbi:MAG: radical SAM family heme chaperone HemW [Magnetococcales bacterium]|nr:radical SAM family heme chaperone HemW [Magnetococcales bacterium]
MYFHIPFCRRKCPYCDFHSLASPRPPTKEYVEALIRDLYRWQVRTASRPVTSIFFGGGTPSLLEPELVSHLLESVRALWRVQQTCEITLEANPDSVSAEALHGWRAAGINRLSLGVQALNEARLRQLGRLHDAHKAEEAIVAAREAGFDNLNLDVMLATPGQRLDSWKKELRRLLAWRPEHLSAYVMSVEEGTPWHAQWQRGQRVMPGERQQLRLMQALWEMLDEAGYIHYEISNWARPGRCCRHNLLIWEFGDYLGIGSGAHGKVTLADGRVVRSEGVREVSRYLEGTGPGWTEEVVAPEVLAQECLLMGLRTRRGLRRSLYGALGGVDRLKVAQEMEEAGLLRIRPTRWQLTRQGILVADSVMTMLLQSFDF